MGDLGFANILSQDKIDDLFGDDVQAQEEQEEQGKGTPPNTPEEEHEQIETHETTEVTEENLFDGDSAKPESVSSEEEDTGGKGNSSTEDGGGTSPQENFYSSIATAWAEDGILPNLDPDEVGKADSAEALSDLVEKEVNARLDEKTRRVAKALENGVEPSTVRAYENTLKNLNAIKESDLKAEDERGEKLRFDLICQDFINNGYSPDRAEKMAKRSIDNGMDLEDAVEALASNKAHFQKKYKELLDDAEAQATKDKEERRKRSEKLNKDLLTDKQLFGGMEISADVRKKAFEKISKPIYKDPETGEYLTAVQRFEEEHPDEFMKYLGLFMALTDDFKDFGSLVKAEVRKEKKKGLMNLESKLNNTRRDAQGNLKMVTTRSEDPESYSSGRLKLAL